MTDSGVEARHEEIRRRRNAQVQLAKQGDPKAIRAMLAAVVARMNYIDEALNEPHPFDYEASLDDTVARIGVIREGFAAFMRKLN